jgi:hypothetical protein
MDNCTAFDKMVEAEETRKVYVNSELYVSIQKQLVGVMGLEENDVKQAMDSLFSKLVGVMSEKIYKLLVRAAEVKIQEFVETKMQERINEVFEKAFLEKFVMTDGSENLTFMSIQKILYEKIIKFFGANSNGYKESDLKQVVERAIESRVSEMSKEAIGELKAETIDKFNKEAMKMMMRGMARTLGEDKKLLKILLEE